MALPLPSLIADERNAFPARIKTLTHFQPNLPLTRYHLRASYYTSCPTHQLKPWKGTLILQSHT